MEDAFPEEEPIHAYLPEDEGPDEETGWMPSPEDAREERYEPGREWLEQNPPEDELPF